MGKKDSADAAATKLFTGDVVAALIMSLEAKPVGMKQYEIMSCIDGRKSASAFQHDFRSINAKIRELKDRIDKGEKFEPVKSGAAKKRAANAMEDNTPPTTPKKQKTTPKAKATPKPRGKKSDKTANDKSSSSSGQINKSPSLNDNDLGGTGGYFNDAFSAGLVKKELQWDE